MLKPIENEHCLSQYDVTWKKQVSYQVEPSSISVCGNSGRPKKINQQYVVNAIVNGSPGFMVKSCSAFCLFLSKQKKQIPAITVPLHPAQYHENQFICTLHFQMVSSLPHFKSNPDQSKRQGKS